MTEQNDLPLEVQRALIQNELAQHKQAEYVLTLRYRVSKKIEAPAEDLKVIQDALYKTLQYIEAYTKELNELK